MTYITWHDLTSDHPKALKVQPNDPKLRGERASKVSMVNKDGNLLVYAVHTQFEGVQWFAVDLDQDDDYDMGLPRVIRQEDNLDALCASLGI